MQDTVLIVGAGPAGLSAAATVSAAGYKVVLIEKEEVLGWGADHIRICQVGSLW